MKEHAPQVIINLEKLFDTIQIEVCPFVDNNHLQEPLETISEHLANTVKTLTKSELQIALNSPEVKKALQRHQQCAYFQKCHPHMQGVEA